MQVRLGTQNKEQLINELVKKAQRGFKCPVFCIGLALLISILFKIKRHFSGTAEGGNRHTMERCVQSTGKATLHQLRHEN